MSKTFTFGIAISSFRLRLDRIADEHDSVLGTGNGALHGNKVLFRINLNDREIQHSDLFVTVLTSHLLVFEHTGRAGVCTHGADLAVNRADAVRGAQGVVIPSLNGAGEAAALGDAGHIDLVAGRKSLGRNQVADIERTAVIQTEFFEMFLGRNAHLGEMAGGGFAEFLFLGVLEAKLNGVIAVVFSGLDLRDNAGARFDYRNRYEISDFV